MATPRRLSGIATMTIKDRGMFLLQHSKKALLPGALALALTLSGCGGEQAVQQSGALPVDIFTVTTVDVPVVSRLTGRATPTRRAEVRPQVSGVIQARLFTEGSTVTAGEQLYQIDPAVYQAQYDSAKASLSSAQANLHTTQLRAERYRRLLATKAVSQQDYDDAQAAYLQAKAEVEAAGAAVQTADINLGYTKVYAPISGRISRSNVTEGALVSAQQADPMTTIQQLDPMYVDLGQTVEAHLQMREAIAQGHFKTQAGKAPVDIYFSNGDKYPIQGQVEFSEVTVDETTGMVTLRAIVPNPDGVLLPGMFLRGDITEGTVPDAPVVQQDAVVREAAGTTYVYVVAEDGTAQRKDIKIGANYESFFVVTEGLKPGDKVITSNLQKIRTGTPVEVVDLTDSKAETPAQ